MNFGIVGQCGEARARLCGRPPPRATSGTGHRRDRRRGRGGRDPAVKRGGICPDSAGVPAGTVLRGWTSSWHSAETGPISPSPDWWPSARIRYSGSTSGNCGFLAEFGPTEIDGAIDDILAGRYKVEERLVLEGTSPSLPGRQLRAANDIVLDKSRSSQDDRTRVLHQRGVRRHVSGGRSHRVHADRIDGLCALQRRAHRHSHERGHRNHAHLSAHPQRPSPHRPCR